jgi:hypothetical protein
VKTRNYLNAGMMMKSFCMIAMTIWAGTSSLIRDYLMSEKNWLLNGLTGKLWMFTKSF